MSDERISLKELREAPWLAVPDDVLALVEAVEAAERVKRELLWGDTRTSYAYESLGTALARFCDYGTDNR